ncbi:MAG: high-potential iron-sulfur protein [Halofilum sp. (in: g-proteobacteria)]
MHDRINRPRRRLLLLIPAVPAAALGHSYLARAEEKSRLDPDSDQAKNFRYVQEANNAADDARKSGAHCANCTHFHGSEGDTWSSCNIFPDHLVHAGGWCTAWVGG